MGSGTIKPDSCSTFKALDAEFATAQLLLAFVTDPRTTPIYPIAEAARIVQAPRSTLCGWVPQHSVLGLTFLELLEAYTIQTLRTRHQLPKKFFFFFFLKKKKKKKKKKGSDTRRTALSFSSRIWASSSAHPIRARSRCARCWMLFCNVSSTEKTASAAASTRLPGIFASTVRGSSSSIRS